MPQSFCRLYGHLIFSTKNRISILDGEVRPNVHAYLATLARDLDSKFVVAGGVEDHVHMLFDMPKMCCAAQFVEKVKKDSSKFVKTLGMQYREFYWQRGYAMFSVGPTQRDVVEKYIRNQEEHHRTNSFQDELRGLLERYGIEFDERYVWD